MIPYSHTENGTLVSIQEARPGLACNCYCPSCGIRLIARKGKRRAHHFAHYRRPECGSALEDSLHAVAKLILKRADKIVLPPLYVHQQDKPVAYARVFQYSQVQLEHPLQKIVPDAALVSAGGTVLVEIAVHHPTTNDKIWQLQQCRLPAIEIDVKQIYLELAGSGKGTDLEAFTDRIINDTRNKIWLFNPKQHALESRMRQTAACKKVKKCLYNNQYYFTVFDCPIGKNTIASGPLRGNTYARVFGDCIGCTHCFEIEYHKKHVGYRRITTGPRFVYCRA